MGVRGRRKVGVRSRRIRYVTSQRFLRTNYGCTPKSSNSKPKSTSFFIELAHIERVTETETERERQREKETEAKRERQRQTDRQRQRKRQTDRQTETDRQAGRQAGRQTDRQRHCDDCDNLFEVVCLIGYCPYGGLCAR